MALNNGTTYLNNAGEGDVPLWTGTYAATVVSNADPLGVGRLQLNVPQVLGNAVSPWAVPAGSYFQIPANGTTLSCVFLGGDPSQPAWNGPLDLSPIVEAAAPPTITYSPSAPASPRVNDVWYETFTDSNGHTIIAAPQVWTFNYPSTGLFGWKVQSSTNTDNGGGVGSTTLGAGVVGNSNLSASVTARSLGGVTTTIAATPPSSPLPNDLWFNSANGYQLNQWSGSAWTPVSWNGADVISAGTITGATIAAHTIAAANIIAGTITSNEIAANTITANNIQAGSLTSSIIGNLGACLNANPFFAGGSTSGWFVSGAGNTIAAVSGGTIPAAAPYGNGTTNWAVQFVAAAGGISNKFSNGNAPFGIQFNNRYTATAWVYSSTAQSVGIGFEWRNSGTLVSSSTTTVAIAANTWTLISSPQNAPASGVTTGNITIYAGAASTIFIQAAQAFPQIQGIVDATTITGANFISDGTGEEIMVYSGTPAAGNLLASVSATSGTDGATNKFKQGMAVYQVSANGAARYWMVTNRAAEFTPAALEGWVQNSGLANEAYLSGYFSAENSNQKDVVGIQIASSASDLSTPAQGFISYFGPTGSSNTNMAWDYSGTQLYVVKLMNAVHPGSGTSPANPASVETWQTISYSAGFGAGAPAARYRLEPMGGGIVRLDGVVNTTAATAANATMFTLPTGYRPTANKRFAGVSSSSGYIATNNGASLIQITSAGVVSCVSACSAAGQVIVLDGITFPVD
jgi:hypothetical protein